jgi:DNA polymerase III subunit delta
VIQFFLGENDFEMKRHLDEMMRSFDGHVERIDGREVEIGQLSDLLTGATLFQDKRLVIISQLSENKAVWDVLPEWLERLAIDTSVVLVEPKPDKRTVTYKSLIKKVERQEFPLWTNKDTTKAVQWVLDEAMRQDVPLTKSHAQQIVERVGIHQWGLFQAIQKLALVDEITSEHIEEIIERRPEENVFALFETALRGDFDRTRQLISTLRLTNDAYQTFGLLSSQVLQLTALARASKPASEVAKDIGAHPYVLSKLSHYAERLGASDIQNIVAAAADADRQMKSSGLDPWLLIEKFLMKIAR